MLQDKKCKLCRREGYKLFLKGSRCESAKCALTRRDYAPGKNKKSHASKMSDYGLQLRSKQAVKKIYKLRENILSSYYQIASTHKGTTGDRLAQLLETRLDNIVYKLGFAPSLSSARQLVSHKHIKIDNKTVNIPSYHVSPKQKIMVDKNIVPMLNNNKNSKNIPQWLELSKDKFQATVLQLPVKSDLPEDVQIQSIIEFYSR